MSAFGADKWVLRDSDGKGKKEAGHGLLAAWAASGPCGCARCGDKAGLAQVGSGWLARPVFLFKPIFFLFSFSEKRKQQKKYKLKKIQTSFVNFINPSFTQQDTLT